MNRSTVLILTCVAVYTLWILYIALALEVQSRSDEQSKRRKRSWALKIHARKRLLLDRRSGNIQVQREIPGLFYNQFKEVYRLDYNLAVNVAQVRLHCVSLRRFNVCVEDLQPPPFHPKANWKALKLYRN